MCIKYKEETVKLPVKKTGEETTVRVRRLLKTLLGLSARGSQVRLCTLERIRPESDDKSVSEMSREQLNDYVESIIDKIKKGIRNSKGIGVGKRP